MFQCPSQRTHRSHKNDSLESQELCLQNVQEGVWGKYVYPNPNKRNSFLLIEGGNEEKSKLWVVKVFLLFYMQTKGCAERRNLFDRNIDCSRTRNNVGEVLEWVPLW